MAGVFALGLLALIAAVLGVLMLADRDKHVLNKNDARLYRKGAAIMARLVNVTDLGIQLEGDLDLLSPATRKQITEWLAEYNKEINKV